MNKEDEIFLINVQVGGLRIPLKIPRKDEEVYRSAEKLLVKYMNEYQQVYRQRPSEEILILVAFRLATIIFKNEFSEDVVPLAEKIQVLDDELNELLSNK